MFSESEKANETKEDETKEDVSKKADKSERTGMDSYYIIAGLGNPGRQYDGSRHNAGFNVIDELADRFRIDRPVRFGKSLIGKGIIGGQKVILMKPLTYMNLSGEAVREVCSYYKVDHRDHLIVISDDIDLPVGHLRIRKKGSAGGHNGLKNIILHLGDDEFTRIRLGVGGKPDPRADLANHVLGHFDAKEREVMEEACVKAADAVVCMIEQGPDKAMNLYNTKKQKKPRKAKIAEETTPAEGTKPVEETTPAEGTAQVKEAGPVVTCTAGEAGTETTSQEKGEDRHVHSDSPLEGI